MPSPYYQDGQREHLRNLYEQIISQEVSIYFGWKSTSRESLLEVVSNMNPLRFRNFFLSLVTYAPQWQ
jgi:hypothetical protein